MCISCRETRTCIDKPCVNIACTTTVSSPDNGAVNDIVVCEIYDWIFLGMVYDLRVEGTNPFVLGISNISVHLDTNIGE